MKAMILAAGKGTRVQPITHDIPKPMIPVITRPVMEMIVLQLKRHGFDHIIANVSHLAHVIEDYFTDGSRLGVQMAFSWEGHFDGDQWCGAALGSAGGMRQIQQRSQFFDDTFVVVCGDAIIDVDFTQALAFHREKKALATVVLRQVPQHQVSNYGVVVTDESGHVKSFQEKPSPEEAQSDLINTGIYLFEPEIFDYIAESGEVDIGSDLFPALVEAGAAFYGISLPFQWIDIGKTPDLWTATSMALRGEINHYTMPGMEISSKLWVGANVKIHPEATINGPTYIGANTVVESGVVIDGPTMVGAGCHIRSGAHIEHSIIWNHTEVSTIARIYERIIFGPHCIARDGTMVNLKKGGFDWLINDIRSKPMS